MNNEFSKLNLIFKNTTNSYKFYWWLSIIEVCYKEKKETVTYNEIILKVISKLWFPVNYFKLSFGAQDQCSKYIKKIKVSFGIHDNISENQLRYKLKSLENNPLMLEIANQLTRYVPFRILRPWYSQELRGVEDNLVNSKIIELQNTNCPYIIIQNERIIKINSNWFNWINTNYKLIESFTNFELIKFLEKNNPNTPNLSNKLNRPTNRKLTKASKYWKLFKDSNPEQTDVFEEKELRDVDKMSIDHYLPWSFTSHDLLFNLHPVRNSINSSKGNFIPNNLYLEDFCNIQFAFFKYLIEQNLLKGLKDYALLFNCSLKELQNINETHFKTTLNKYILQQVDIAKDMGFDYGWRLSY